VKAGAEKLLQESESQAKQKMEQKSAGTNLRMGYQKG